MRICVIGNSHVAALKSAWDEIAESRLDLDLTFFAARARLLDDLVAQDGALVPASEDLARSMKFTSGGYAKIAPEHFDAFLVYGLGAREVLIERGRGFSGAVLERAVADHLAENLSFKIVRMIRGMTTVPIYVGHNPLRALPGGADIRADAGAYSRGIEVLNRYGYAPYGAELISQPMSTIAGSRRTKAEYSAGSTTLVVGEGDDGVRHSEDDLTHMNSAFGSEWLSEFVGVLDRTRERSGATANPGG